MTSPTRLDLVVEVLRRPIAPQPDFEGRLLGRIRRATIRRRIVRVMAAVGVVLLGGYLSWSRQPAAIEFAIELPAAKAVHLVGDFNDWDRTRTPLARVEGTGRWQARLRLPSGLYHYAYLVDGVQWTVDPTAPDSLDADFGTAVALLPVEVSR